MSSFDHWHFSSAVHWGQPNLSADFQNSPSNVALSPKCNTAISLAIGIMRGVDSRRRHAQITYGGSAREARPQKLLPVSLSNFGPLASHVMIRIHKHIPKLIELWECQTLCEKVCDVELSSAMNYID